MSQKEKQMEIVIKELKKGKSRKEAAEVANIPLYRIVHWYNEGKNGFGNDNIGFYNKLNMVEGNQVKSDSESVKHKKCANQPVLKKLKNLRKYITINLPIH